GHMWERPAYAAASVLSTRLWPSSGRVTGARAVTFKCLQASHGCNSTVELVWLKCVDDVRDAGRDDVESCAGLMGPLWDCMQHNSAYYSPQLDSLASRKPGEPSTAAWLRPLANKAGKRGDELH
ncbi:GCK domain-containing protein, partial [Haematococcus lacustris]